MGWDLHYGRTDLISINAPLRPDDIPLRPGETHVFTIAERFVSAFEEIVRENGLAPPKKVRAIFQFINLGDGTGFSGTGKPLPHATESPADSKRDNPKDPASMAWHKQWKREVIKRFVRGAASTSNCKLSGV